MNDLNRTYWTSGADRVFRLQQCPDCGRMIHPPALRCQYDHGVPEWVELSGGGIVESWTVNHHPFFPGIPTPYVVAFVNPVEDDRVRVLANLVDVDPVAIEHGMPVRIRFEHCTDGDAADDVWVPLFVPET